MAKIHALLPHGAACYPVSVEMQESADSPGYRVTVEFRVSSAQVADRLWEACHEVGHKLSLPPEKPKDLSKFKAMEGDDG